MKKIINHIPLLFALYILLFSNGCKMPAATQIPHLQQMPASFSKTDTLQGIGVVPWRSFFSDKYLINLLESAISNNTDLLIALQRVEMASADVMFRSGELLPHVNAALSGGVEHYGDYTMNGVGNFDTNLSPNIGSKQKIPAGLTPDIFIGFRSEWEIDIWGKLKNQKKAALIKMLATKKGHQYAVTSVIAAVANRYYQLLAFDNKLKILQKNIFLQQQAADAVKVLKEAGRANELAVQQFQAQLMNTMAKKYATLHAIAAVENQLNILTGSYPKRIARDTSIMNLFLPASLSAGLPAEMLQQRPDVQEALLQMEAAKINVEVAKKAFLPSLKIAPFAGINAFNPALLFNAGSVVYGALGGLTSPIFNKTRISSNYKIASAEGLTAFAQYKSVLLNSFGEVSTILDGLYNAQQAYQLKQEEVNQLSGAITTANDLYLAGAASYLDVLTAQKGILEAELELTENKKELFTGAVNLYKSLGGGWN